MPLTATMSPGAAISLIANELLRVAERTSVANAHQLIDLADLVDDSRRVFVLGAGRSGLALRMTAMRLMHLGLDVHVVGDTTTPAIAAGDLLLTASGSGTTESIVRAAERASAIGARIAAITTAEASPLSELADVVVRVPAAQKLDRSADASQQYAGSLFEQAVVVIGDGLFHALWQREGTSADDLWPRHANLE
ncbi:6-phospho-3-hexuloisomerase [Microbacterium sp. WCS2018Hpa-9]|uniref:6-phospho-3-hexuloisomerase n=1 Tax=Microbacterium sp. WCS2018Hpa-9 TaxID=3073635 RepID=UPI00288B1E40|nr:6-phospho-3-hexuloisomerase [Microbacterium sp. WCS2018Hpa-9]